MSTLFAVPFTITALIVSVLPFAAPQSWPFVAPAVLLMSSRPPPLALIVPLFVARMPLAPALFVATSARRSMMPPSTPAKTSVVTELAALFRLSVVAVVCRIAPPAMRLFKVTVSEWAKAIVPPVPAMKPVPSEPTVPPLPTCRMPPLTVVVPV